MTLPLEDIRVLDLTRILTGPFCTMILADLGAEVIKVEMPRSGDDTRHWGPPFIGKESAYFLSINRNKKSLTLNLKKEKGRKILYSIAKKSDVLLENFRPGVTERLKVDFKTISQINPQIVYCSISSFGQTGPYRDRLAYDLVIQGMGGLMGITGEPDHAPVRIGVAIADIGAGMYGAIAVLSAIMAQKRTKKGRRIDISLLDGTVSWLTYMAANYFATGKNPRKLGSAHPNIVPYQCFEAGDGKYLTLAVGNDSIWKNFCKAIGYERLIYDERFSTNPKRVKNRETLVDLLIKLFATRSRSEWIEALLSNEVPCGPVYTLDEIFTDPQVLHRNMVLEINHPKVGKIKQIGIPMKFSEMSSRVNVAPPLLGQHNKEILGSLLKLSEKEIKKLEQEGVI